MLIQELIAQMKYEASKVTSTATTNCLSRNLAVWCLDLVGLLQALKKYRGPKMRSNS